MNNSPSRSRRARAAILAAALAAACLATGGCQRGAGGTEPPLAGAAIGGPFTLIDQDGRTRTDSMFAGRYRLMYFGYTYCPDVCPDDVQHLMRGYQALAKADPAKAAKLSPIFVTVDPARDTPAVLRQFVRAFDPRLIGLTGPEAEIAAIVKRYGAYRHVQPRAPGAAGYLVDHMRTAMLFGPDGKPIAIITQDAAPEAIAAELAQWIA